MDYTVYGGLTSGSPPCSESPLRKWKGLGWARHQSGLGHEGLPRAPLLPPGLWRMLLRKAESVPGQGLLAPIGFEGTLSSVYAPAFQQLLAQFLHNFRCAARLTCVRMVPGPTRPSLAAQGHSPAHGKKRRTERCVHVQQFLYDADEPS